MQRTSDVSSAVQHIIPGDYYAEDVLEFDTSVSIGGRQLCNLRFAGIDLLVGSERQLQELAIKVEKASARFGLEISC